MSNEVCDEITYPLPNVNLHRLVIDTLFKQLFIMYLLVYAGTEVLVFMSPLVAVLRCCQPCSFCITSPIE